MALLAVHVSLHEANDANGDVHWLQVPRVPLLYTFVVGTNALRHVAHFDHRQ